MRTSAYRPLRTWVVQLSVCRARVRRVSRVSASRMAAAADPDASEAVTPGLPDAICVHCGQRFNSAHLTYGLDTKKLSAKVVARRKRPGLVLCTMN